jgi:hypothetical protein
MYCTTHNTDCFCFTFISTFCLLQGRREGGGGQNTGARSAQRLRRPGNLGKMFVLFIIALGLS